MPVCSDVDHDLDHQMIMVMMTMIMDSKSHTLAYVYIPDSPIET